MTSRSGPWIGQMLLKVVQWGTYDDANELLTEDVNEAHVATSIIAGHSTMHRVVLDIDMEAELIPSSTPGHYHLYIDQPMPWPVYVDLLRALVKAGIVEEGYVGASERRGFTCVRLPWVKKSTALDDKLATAPADSTVEPF